VSETGFPTPSLPPAPSAGITPDGTTLPGGVPPGTVPGGSKTFGQILDRVLQLMRANWRLFVGIALVPGAGMIAYFGIMFAAYFPVVKSFLLHQTLGFSPMAMVRIAAAYILGLILMIVIFSLYEPAAAYAALQANAGTRVTFRSAWVVAWSKAGRYIWLAILRALIVMAPIFVFAALFIGSLGLSLAHGRGGTDSAAMVAFFPLIMLFYLGAMVYAVLVMLRLVLAVPVCVAEDVSAWDGIRRSNQLTRGAKGRIFLLGLLIYAIAYAAFLVAEMVIFFLGAMVALAGMLLHLTMAPWGYIGIGAAGVVFLCMYILWYACVWAAYTTLFAVVYQDQRLRLEGAAAART
jgi:hypothetical protein